VGGFESIVYQKEKGRARITLSRPQKLNAITLKMMVELNEALWEADNDRDVHCVIIKGAGRSFSSG
jgi:enoyl-CoA hydratase